MSTTQTTVRAYTLRLYPNPGKAKEAFGILLEQRTWLYEFVRQHMATGEESWTTSTAGLGWAANRALHRAKGIIKAGHASSIATGNQFNAPRCLPLIGDGTVEPATETTFDYWIKQTPGPRMPAKSHTALNNALRRGGTLTNTAEIAVDRKGRLIARVFVRFEKHEAVDTGDYIGVDVGVNAGVARSDGYLGKSLRPILDRTREKRAEQQRQGHTRSARLSSCKQFLNREAKRLVASAKRGQKSIAVESSKTLANLRPRGDIGGWARGQLGLRVRQLAELQGVSVRDVWAAYSSVECRECGCRDKRNRSGVVFLCTQCRSSGHADTLASRTLRDRGRAAFLRRCVKGTKNLDRLLRRSPPWGRFVRSSFDRSPPWGRFVRSSLVISERTYEKVVSAGIALLDKDKADWRTRIDAETLDLTHWDHCILAQSYPTANYWATLRDLFPQVSANEDRHAFCTKAARAHGFSLRYDAPGEEFEELKCEWLRQMDEGKGEPMEQ